MLITDPNSKNYTNDKSCSIIMYFIMLMCNKLLIAESISQLEIDRTNWLNFSPEKFPFALNLNRPCNLEYLNFWTRSRLYLINSDFNDFFLIRTQRSITKRFDPNGALIFPLFTACPEEILWPFIQITQPKNLDNEKEVSFKAYWAKIRKEMKI